MGALRWVRLVVGALALVCAMSAGPVLSAAAQDTPTTGVPAPNIIPEPNQGRAPTDAGERGGALQLVVLVVIVGAIATAIVHLTRQARRSGS